MLSIAIHIAAKSGTVITNIAAKLRSLSAVFSPDEDLDEVVGPL